MFKKLVALTLVALMVINPMAAYAVSWDTIKADLLEKKSFERTENIEASVDDEGNVTITGYGGSIEDFKHIPAFKSYSFKGNITIGGQTFEVYVHDVPVRNEDGSEKKDENGNTVMQAQQVVVNVDNGVAITAEEVHFGVGGTSELTVNTSGSVGLAVDKETNSLVVVTKEVFANVEDSAKLTFNNDGKIEVTDSINFNVDENGAGSITVTNGTVDENGTVNTEASMTTGVNVGVYMWGDGTISFTNNGQITTDTDKTDVEEDSEEDEERVGMIGIGVWGSGDTTVVNGKTGVVNGEMTGWLETDSAEASVSLTNQGTVNGSMSAWGQTVTVTDEDGNAVLDENGNAITYGEGSINLNNEGTINGDLRTFTEENTSTTVTNSKTVEGNIWAESRGTQDMEVTVTKDGTAGNLYANALGETTLNVQNDGIIHGDLSANADGIYDDDDNLIEINGGSTVNLTNNGTAENIYSGAVGAGTITVTNNNTVNNELVVDTINGTVNVINDGTVGGQLDGWANGENGSVTVINTGNGTVGSGEDGNGIWVSAENGATVESINAGTVNGELGGGAYTGGDTIVANLGTADSSWVESYDGGNLTLDNSNVITETPVAAGNSKITVVIATEGSEITDAATVGALYKQSVVNWEGRTGETKIITTTQDGQPIALYSVAADGTIVLEEVLMEQGGGDGDDPRFWTKERIRHDMEEKRKAAEIGGVYGSPYWLKQLYLGYMSLNLRLFDGEEQLLFKENISWVPGANVAGEKILTLNVKIEDTSSLAMRLDGAVIDKLEQADIVTINIVDGAGNLFMEYQVEDLKGAREMYGLTVKESIVVGSADADVMKIAEDGTISPIEGETEAEPAA